MATESDSSEAFTHGARRLKDRELWNPTRLDIDHKPNSLPLDQIFRL